MGSELASGASERREGKNEETCSRKCPDRKWASLLFDSSDSQGQDRIRSGPTAAVALTEIGLMNNEQSYLGPSRAHFRPSSQSVG